MRHRHLFFLKTWLLLMGLSQVCSAQNMVPASAENFNKNSDQKIIRRVSIFPFKAPPELAQVAEDAWWKVRAEMTEKRRFLVASRHFLNIKEVLQPRGKLDAPDVLVLSKLLEAHALITCSITGDRIHFSVYEGRSGWLLWEKSLLFDQDIPVKEQVLEMSTRLVQGFIAAIPFQGFLVKDPFSGETVVTEGDVSSLTINVGSQTQIQQGDVFQVVNYHRKDSSPLYEGLEEAVVLASGRVLRLDGEQVLAEIINRKENAVLKPFQIVRFPKEAERLRRAAHFSSDPSELLLKEISQKAEPKKEDEAGPLLTALTFIGNALLILVLAF